MRVDDMARQLRAYAQDSSIDELRVLLLLMFLHDAPDGPEDTDAGDSSPENYYAH